MKIILSFLLAALAHFALPVHAADACKYPVIAELPITFVGASLHPAINGTIDGTPAVMLVDTGASTSAMTMTGVRRRGLPLRITGRQSYGIGGVSTMYDVRLRELTAGAFRSGKTMVSVIASTAHAPSYDAIIGAPFLLSSDMEIRLAEKKLTFFQPDGCGDTYLGYWDEPSVAVPFLYDKQQGNSPNPRFQVTVNGTPLRAMIDTGASKTIINREAAERAGIDLAHARPTGAMGGIGDDRITTWQAHVATVSIGEETIRNAELTVATWDRAMPQDILLGADFLRTHRVLFAMKQRKVYFAYQGGEAFPARKDMPTWLRQEAEAGNNDAEMAMARFYRYAGPGATPEGGKWLARAAAHGNAWAHTDLGIQLMNQGKYDDAIGHMRTAMQLIPGDRYTPFSLYQARVLAGQEDIARQELMASAVANGRDLWPAQMVDFYLGKTDAAALLKTVNNDPGTANFRVCEAQYLMADWYHAHGNVAEETARRTAAKVACPARS